MHEMALGYNSDVVKTWKSLKKIRSLKIASQKIQSGSWKLEIEIEVEIEEKSCKKLTFLYLL